jgi:hypothetical protein
MFPVAGIYEARWVGRYVVGSREREFCGWFTLDKIGSKVNGRKNFPEFSIA